MRRSMRVFVSILLAQAALATPLLAGIPISVLSGVWVGNGTVRPNGFDDPVVVRCKVKGELQSQVQALFEGRCATTEGAGAFRLMIAQDKNGETFAAKMGGADAMLDFKGHAVKHTIVLDQQAPTENHGRTLTSRITLETGVDGKIAFTTEVRDVNSGQTQRAFVVQFVRR